MILSRPWALSPLSEYDVKMLCERNNVWLTAPEIDLIGRREISGPAYYTMGLTQACFERVRARKLSNFLNLNRFDDSKGVL